MSELSLVSIKDLIDEIEKRCDTFVAAYLLKGTQEANWMQFRYGKGTWFKAIQLSDVLHNDCLNNWSGELKTLQRIAEEEKEDE